MNKAGERDKVLTWRGETSQEGVSGVTEIADANGAVIDHFALGIYSTLVRAGRRTFLIDASAIRRALTVHHAFGATVGRVADKIRETGANSKAVCIATLAVWSTGRRAARVYFREDCVERNIVMHRPFWMAISRFLINAFEFETSNKKNKFF